MKPAVVILVTMILASPAFAGTLPDFPFIIVTGTARAEVSPDKATLGFEVVAFDKDPRQATAVVAEQSSAVVKLARKLGISDDHIESFGIDKRIRRQRKNYEDLAILGYDVSQNFVIHIDDIRNFTPLVNALVVMKNVGHIETNFDRSDRKRQLRKLVKQAAADARKRAANLAATMGVKIKSVYAVNEDESFSDDFAKFRLGRSDNDGIQAYVRSPRRSGTLVTFVPESILLRKVVNVVYKIQP